MTDRRRGEVFIAPDYLVPADGSMVDPASARFRVSWQDDDEQSVLEDDEVVGAEAAIAWGRERSPMVWIRLGNRGDTYFSAGDEHPADEDPEEFVPRWPPDGPPPNGWWKAPSIPTLAEVHAISRRLKAGELSASEAARWASERFSVAMRAEDQPDRETLDALVALFDDDPRLAVVEPEIRCREAEPD